ncbi:hypothetical protein [Methylobacter sp.]|uniref:hypothetical protein n=1 Tax=Methylobacter sp. TaxID=2051955 RepID=UPI001209F2C2|nr:hypothetical protein [Methylobacter sp.]TAK62303.1 MAG: hypothetical protein EPO18_10895 [Methylobacter sp.]
MTISTSFLNKSEAVHHLHNRYEEFITGNGLDDTHPNFQSLIHENVRNPYSMSAIAKGYPRGNRAAYGVIETVRISNRPYFARQTLDEWFDKHYAPKLLKAAA